MSSPTRMWISPSLALARSWCGTERSVSTSSIRTCEAAPLRRPACPFIPGKEGAGEVRAIGEGVHGFAPGDRVAYVETLGAYAEECVVPVHFLVHLPDAIDYETAAAMMLKASRRNFCCAGPSALRRARQSLCRLRPAASASS